MFKYIKTLNNNSHPTEIISVFSGNDNENYYAVKAGSIVSVSYGEILPTYDNTSLKYLTISSKNEREAKYIKCIRLLPGMVLEADTDPNSDAELFFVGALCDAMVDNTEKGAFLTRDGNPNFEIIDATGAEHGKVKVVVI